MRSSTISTNIVVFIATAILLVFPFFLPAEKWMRPHQEQWLAQSLAQHSVDKFVDVLGGEAKNHCFHAASLRCVKNRHKCKLLKYMYFYSSNLQSTEKTNNFLTET